jgi:hypothetical protein
VLCRIQLCLLLRWQAAILQNLLFHLIDVYCLLFDLAGFACVARCTSRATRLLFRANAVALNRRATMDRLLESLYMTESPIEVFACAP